MSADFLAELDMLGVPLFLLRAKPGGPIKGKWAAPPKGWQHRTAEQNEAVIAGWRPGMAVGALMGHAFDAIDVDPRHGGAASRASMARDGLIPTVHGVAETMSGGNHLFVSPTDMKNSVGLLPGIDMRTRGGFVLIAPTEGYRVLPRAEWPDLGAQPDDALDRLRTLGQREAPVEGAEAGPGPVTPEEAQKASNVLEMALREVRGAAGARNDTVSHWLPLLYGFAEAGALDRHDVDERMWAAAQEASGDGPYTRSEFNASRRSAGRVAQPQRPRVDTAADDFPPFVDDEPTDGPLARFPRLSLRELLDPNRPPREWVVEGLLLAGTANAFIAPAGHRKSLVTLSIGLTVARGDADWAGLPIPRARRVMYVDMENTEDDLRERLLSFGVTKDEPNFILISMPSMRSLDTPKGGAEFLAAVDAFGMESGDLVVLDSYQRITEAGENDSDTTRAYFRHTAVGLKRRGLTVIRTDNTGKDTARGARGSSGKRDDVDVEYLIKSTGDLVEFTRSKVRQRGEEGLTVRVTTDGERTTFSSTHGTVRQSDVEACVTWLDEHEVDPGTGHNRTVELLRDGGRLRFPRAVVRDAVRLRKERSEAFE